MITYQKENLSALAAKIEGTFGERLLGKEEKNQYIQFSVMAGDAKALLRFLKESPDLAFTYFIDCCGVDYLKYPKPMPERFAVVTTLLSPTLGVKVQVRAFVPASPARIESNTDLFHGANWTEREIHDLYGIDFTGHPDLKRILMPDDYEGHPLRKDYPLRGRGERGSFPVYHAIPADQAPDLNKTPAPFTSGRLKMYSYEQEVTEQTDNIVHMNVGPSHPAMHGTLRVKMEVQGERVLRAEQEIGFLHTGFEKLGEHRTYNQFITLSDRLNYFSPLNNNIGFAIAVEELIGLETPRRCQVIRTILAEMSRLADHSLCVGAMAMDLGAFTSILWTFVEREKLYDVFEAVTGTRLTTSYTRVGGVAFDLPADFEKRVVAILDSMEKTVEKLRGSFYKNRIFLDRVEGVGIISKQDVMDYGITGPMARASGVEYDLRKFKPYLIYNELDFDVPVYTEGDCLARYKVRLDEMDQSIRLVRQALKKLEPGPISAQDQKHALPDKLSTYTDMESLIHHFKMVMPGPDHGINPPITDLYSATEAPNGELGWHIVSDGGSNPWRVRIRPPSFINYPIFRRLMEGSMLADVVAILASFNVIAGELDR